MTKETGKLTKSKIDAAFPGKRDAYLWDSEIRGFGVKVTPAGSKVFIYQYRLGGRGSPTRRYRIGQFGSITADKARDVARDLAAQIAKGIDPQGERMSARAKAKASSVPDLLDRFEKEYLKAEWRRSFSDAKSALDLHVRQKWAKRSLVNIGKADVKSLLSTLGDRPAARNKLHVLLNLFFKWAVDGDIIDANPMADMTAPSPLSSRDRVLKDEELLLVWQASGKLTYPFGPMYRLLICTGQRLREVSALDWKELDRDNLMWTVPGARAKNGKASTVPLNELALEELDSIAKSKKWPKRGLVFSVTGKTPVSGFSRAKRRLDTVITKLNKKEELEPWRNHDLRRTLATGLQRLGVRFEVTEAVLNHVSGSRSGVAGIYQQHDWGPEKRAAMDAWAAHIRSVLLGHKAGDNVVQLDLARA